MILSALCLSLQACVVGMVVGAVVDVGVEVVKVPFKIGKAVYDVATDDDDEDSKKEKDKK
ncbi:MAG TPA: NF038104 family lipoprotein [Rhodocyclaceae bacterium]|nr:NF038104 family lipoprotein [Rhodocyclaceae bacterium]